MIISIILTSISIGNLLMLASLRHYTRGIVWLSIINGIFVIQTAHGIPAHAESSVDYALSVRAVFGLLYIPALFVLGKLFEGKENWYRFRLIFFVLALLLFVFLYYHMIVIHSMQAISFANLLWHVQVVLMLVIFQGFTRSSLQPSGRVPANSRNESALAKVWMGILLLPYLVSFMTWIFPADNFILPYTPALSDQVVIELATCFGLIFVSLLAFRHKVLLDRESRSASPDRKVEDFVF